MPKDIQKKLFNNQPNISYGDSQSRENDYAGSISNIDETYSSLGWKPEYDLLKGLDDYIRLYREDIE